jgi:hypothetical protein
MKFSHTYRTVGRFIITYNLLSSLFISAKVSYKNIFSQKYITPYFYYIYFSQNLIKHTIRSSSDFALTYKIDILKYFINFTSIFYFGIATINTFFLCVFCYLFVLTQRNISSVTDGRNLRSKLFLIRATVYRADLAIDRLLRLAALSITTSSPDFYVSTEYRQKANS